MDPNQFYLHVQEAKYVKLLKVGIKNTVVRNQSKGGNSHAPILTPCLGTITYF